MLLRFCAYILHVTMASAPANSKFVLPARQFILDQLASIPPVQLPVYMCANGHYLDEEVKRCPICKVKPVIRCDFLEKLIRNCTFPCPYVECDEVKDGSSFNAHIQRLCHYRPITCPYCNEAIQFNNYFNHLRGAHELPGDEDDDSPRLTIPIHVNLQRYGMYFKKFQGKIYFIRTYSGPNEGAYFWVEYFGAKGEEVHYSATVQLTSETSHRTTIRFPVSPIRSELDSLNKTKAYAHISRNSLLNYIDGYKVTVSVFIQPVFNQGREVLDGDSAC